METQGVTVEIAKLTAAYHSILREVKDSGSSVCWCRLGTSGVHDLVYGKGG